MESKSSSQESQENKLQRLLQKESLYTKHLKLLGLLAIVMLWGVLFTDDIGASFKGYVDIENIFETAYPDETTYVLSNDNARFSRP